MDLHGSLLTERLRLRSARGGDSAFVAQLLRNEAVRSYLGGVVALERLDATVADCLKASSGEVVASVNEV